MLDDDRVSTPFLPESRPLPASPYAAPAIRGTPDTGRYRDRGDLAPDPDAEPLWVLPAEKIPTSAAGVPGRKMTRDRGHLDTPETISGISRERLTRDTGRLDAGLSWDYCGPRRGASSVPGPSDEDVETGGPVDLEAGGLTYRQDTQVIEAGGDARLSRGGQRIEADRITYDRRSGDVATTGETYLQYPGLRILGDDARLNLDSSQGRMDDVRYRLSGPINLRGSAAVVHIDDAQLTRYDDIVYTTCPPGSNAWSLRAGSLRLDQHTGRGIAKNARLRIRGIPVLYTPYLEFPIDNRRKSGFLIPSVGSSDDNGVELMAPYYWNIAPNLDATFYPRYMSRRGLMLGGEFRYLTRRDRGTIDVQVLPRDAADEEDGTRAAAAVREQGLFFGRLSTSLDYSIVSDDRYLEDFGNNIDATSTRFLTQRGDVTYLGRGWSLLTRLQAFQTLDPDLSPESRPYGQLPQLLFTLSPRTFEGGLSAGLQADYTYFDHNHLVHGQRFSVSPTLSWPLQRSYGHLIPTANLYLTSYSLQDAAPGQPNDPGHAIPSVNLNGKLIFERDASWLGEQALQTLEPRVYYLYTPYVDQDDAPVFDSSELTFNFSNLFRSNRFTGRDRIGDANQLTAALTSRTLRAASGEELFRLSLGQIFYFADRRVQIAGPEQTERQSPFAGELAATLFDNWQGRASFEWDPERDQDQWQRRTLQLQYLDPKDRLLNLAYRADDTVAPDNRYEDADLSFRLPLGERVEVVGRWLYSLLREETVDAFAGIEFGRCCWRVRLVGRHFKRRPDEAASTSVMLQLELAGLGAIGSPVGNFLEREIYGYQAD
jgi:LPS-assembly protein